MTDARGWHE
jgi:hypothetical protein